MGLVQLCGKLVQVTILGGVVGVESGIGFKGGPHMGCRFVACVRIVGYIACLIIYMCMYVDLIWSDSWRVVEYKFVYRDL